MTKLFFVLCFIFFFGFNTIAAQDYKTHLVKKGETIEGIAKQHYVTPFDIYYLNPEAKKGLKLNTILIIPASRILKPKVSTVKKIQGFKNHKTARKETLYSIAKKYNISEDDIKKNNKFLYEKTLRKGDKLKIPIITTTQIKETFKLTKKYTVLPKEGKWRIAHKFGITVKDLEALNLGMKDVLKEGQMINVPNIKSNKATSVVDDNFSYYEVLPKEGYYRLKLKLGLEQSELEALNPDLLERGLREGMVLKIPYTTNTPLAEQEKLLNTNLSNGIKDFNTKNLAVMLPFRLDRVMFDSIHLTKKSIKKDPYLNASLDFYSGVLLAADSLKSLGISLKLDVYDTKYQVDEVSRIVRNNDFNNVDALIGPLTTKSFDRAASELRTLNIPVISPIGTNLNLYENVFQSRTSGFQLKNRMIQYVKANALDSNIIIISDSENMAVSNSLKVEFSGAKQIFSKKNKEGVDKYYLGKQEVQDALTAGNNVVFLETKDEGYVSNVVSVLASLIQKENTLEKKEEIKIVLVTTNYNKAFESDEVSNEYLSKLEFHFATPSRISNGNNTFERKYRNVYGTIPNKRAVKGFDLTMDVVLRLVSSESMYTSTIDTPLTEYVENKFRYKKKPSGGYYNDQVYLVKYKDLNIVDVD